MKALDRMGECRIMPVFLLVTALLLGSCSGEPGHGGFGPPPSPTLSAPGAPADDSDRPPRLVTVYAPGGLRYEPEAIEIRADRVTELELVNHDTQEHTFVVSELAVAMLAGPGQAVRSLVAVDRKNRGEFRFFCSVSGHREGGMEGTIEVR